MLYNSKGELIEKGLADSYRTLTNLPTKPPEGQRGYSVYSMSELFGVTGYDKEGQRITGKYEQSYFYLSVYDRIEIARLCSPVAGIVSSRQNRISGLNWKIIPEDTDKMCDRLQEMKQIYDEYESSTDQKYVFMRAYISKKIRDVLVDSLPDLSNFRTSLLRYKKKAERNRMDSARAAEAWLEQPNVNDRWDDFVKKYVFDLMIHGSVSCYKQYKDGIIENFFILPGGSVYPLKTEYVTTMDAYVQMMEGYDPQIYFRSELSFENYLPTSARAYGNIPLEALINKIAESMLFDKLMADQADGSQLPNKMVVMGNNSPFGNLTENFEIMDKGEQKRLEAKLMEYKKGGIVTFSGNTATVLDLTRENTMSVQMQRQKDIREDVGLVFNASNMEMNLTGSSNTSGRETGETQMEISEGRGIVPICYIIENMINKEILPYRFGPGFTFEFDKGQIREADIDRIMKMVQTGAYSINEIRVNGFAEDPVDDPKADIPTGLTEAAPANEQEGFGFGN